MGPAARGSWLCGAGGRVRGGASGPHGGCRRRCRRCHLVLGQNFAPCPVIYPPAASILQLGAAGQAGRYTHTHASIRLLAVLVGLGGGAQIQPLLRRLARHRVRVAVQNGGRRAKCGAPGRGAHLPVHGGGGGGDGGGGQFVVPPLSPAAACFFLCFFFFSTLPPPRETPPFSSSLPPTGIAQDAPGRVEGEERGDERSGKLKKSRERERDELRKERRARGGAEKKAAQEALQRRWGRRASRGAEGGERAWFRRLGFATTGAPPLARAHTAAGARRIEGTPPAAASIRSNTRATRRRRAACPPPPHAVAAEPGHRRP